MTYWHISGSPGNYSIFIRNTEAKYPFITQLFNEGGTRNNVRSWKTQRGAAKFADKKEWFRETSEEYKERHAAYKTKLV